MKKFITKVNETIALRATMVFGSMWTCYALFFYGFIPIRFPLIMDKLLYWSNTIQLWSLPLLMVGQNLMGRSTEKRAQQDHETLLNEFELTKDEMKKLQSIVESQQVIIEKLNKLLERDEENGWNRK